VVLSIDTTVSSGRDCDVRWLVGRLAQVQDPNNLVLVHHASCNVTQGACHINMQTHKHSSLASTQPSDGSDYSFLFVYSRLYISVL
jgi:hypothetical protein